MGNPLPLPASFAWVVGKWYSVCTLFARITGELISIGGPNDSELTFRGQWSEIDSFDARDDSRSDVEFITVDKRSVGLVEELP